jgi:hypothetical protein
VHRDIAQSHLSHRGVGEIYSGGKLRRKDGLFVDAALRRLDPDELASTLAAASTWDPGRITT